jgi:hypothetical protein
VIGPKKLSTIRREIEKVFASAGDDPIERLERLVASAKHKGDGTGVMEDLKQFLESHGKRLHRKVRVGRKS